MKWSKYNTIIDNEDEYLIYNSSRNKLMVIVKEIKKILCDNINNIDGIQIIHPDLYDYLCKQKFIVSDKLDESRDVIKKMQKEFNSSRYFKITVNPTMNCNLRCWYCYETHLPKSFVNERVMRSIKLLIHNKIEFTELKYFNLSFFGGEPLLRFKDTVLPLIMYAKSLCDKNKTELTVSFTTNAVLLTPKVADELATTGIRMNFQIPFDGNKYFHDRTKKYANGRGTYTKIVNNVKYALEKELFSFNLRCNYTRENLDSFEEMINDFNHFSNIKERLGFSFQRIWQVSEEEKMNKGVERLENMVAEFNLVNINNSHETLFGPCYADQENSVVVNYNGDIYNCTARDFLPENKEGILDATGNILYNEKHKKRMSVRFENELCIECKIFPLCDICSQKRLESVTNDNCLRMASENEKQHLIRKHIRLISKNVICIPV